MSIGHVPCKGKAPEKINAVKRRALQHPELQKVWADPGDVTRSSSSELLAQRAAAAERAMWGR